MIPARDAIEIIIVGTTTPIMFICFQDVEMTTLFDLTNYQATVTIKGEEGRHPNTNLHSSQQDDNDGWTAPPSRL